MKRFSTYCDYCDADITDTGSEQAFMIECRAVEIPNTSLCATDVFTPPPLAADRHFCCYECLRRMVEEGKF